MYTYVENNPLKYRDPSGHFKDSDNDVLKQLVQPFEIAYENGYTDAEKAADAVRVSYYCGNKVCGYNDYLPSDVKHRVDTYDMYLEGKYGNVRELPVWEDPVAMVVLTVVSDGYYAIARNGFSSFNAGTKLYQITSKESAQEVAKTGVLKGSQQEAGQVFGLTRQPTYAEAKMTGARSLETVIEFEVPASWSAVDKSVSTTLQSIARKSNGPINVSNVREVGFKKQWYNPSTWFK
ncbi:hypothetical protein P4H65_20465 [Paenibacillus chitinolyticus]|uniref:hypothetical protein n=1 Tax=Paenibacillus chitinolyticus TaxID=79263 RepID=UPI002DBF8FCB|nr:hypothetical protein [Paenibacillus chitinolyticus]MEC0248174.1 hypothetical protein [Paenibacillus chitinolyticus]